MRNKMNCMSPDDHYQDLKRVILACSGKARRINVIMPYLYESRQHRRNSRESLDCAHMLEELDELGVSNVITFDVHDDRVSNAAPTVGFENVPTSYQILGKMIESIPDLQFEHDKTMVISPDEGAIARTMFYASVLGVPLGTFYKRRDYTVVKDGRNPIIAHEFLGGSVEGRDAILIDDIISSGESMLDIARTLKKNGASYPLRCDIRLFVDSSPLTARRTYCRCRLLHKRSTDHRNCSRHHGTTMSICHAFWH